MKRVWDEVWSASIGWIWSKQIPIRTRIHGVIQVFHFHFADFVDFEDFNWPALQEGAVCSWSLYGMNYRADRGLAFHLHRTRFAQELMEIFRFFISISPILLILRISTGQPIKKEQSVHEAFIGWILEVFERFNSVQTEFNSPKNSWRYSGFSLKFCWFC